ncbi:MAG: hypothetical protein GXP25_02840 [Planctomycetes bacterium]|nr:hypothetical protein [Planctomycetota bacterium]
MGEPRGFIRSLSVTDWNQQKRVDFDGKIELDSSVGEILKEAVHRLDLPRNTAYSAVLEGRKLINSETLDKAGVKEADEIMVTPEVTAG